MSGEEVCVGLMSRHRETKLPGLLGTARPTSVSCHEKTSGKASAISMGTFESFRERTRVEWAIMGDITPRRVTVKKFSCQI